MATLRNGGCILGIQGPPGSEGNSGSTELPGSAESTSRPTNSSTLCPGCVEP